jgi:hypothetical protein
VQFRRNIFNSKKAVKVQPECTQIASAIVARFIKPDQPPAKKLPAAGIELDTRCQYCATDNREAGVTNTNSRRS